MVASQTLAGHWPSRLRLRLRTHQICRTCVAATQVARFSSSPRPLIGTKFLAKKASAKKDWDEKGERITKGEEPCLWDIFQERGYVKDIAGTSDGIRELMRRKRIGAYVGIDPTAKSLHLGHLLPLMPLFWMYMHGFHAVTLLGTATAKVGDPTGRLTDRAEMRTADLTKNSVAIHYQLKKMWTNVEAQARTFGYEREWAWKRGLVNNNTWWNKQPMLEFMRLLGSRVRVGPMLAKDTVKRKLTEGDGLSFAELSYTLMQGWDWWELYKQQGIQMQIGGSDQYGNIVQGTDAVKMVRQASSHDTIQYETGFLHDPVGFTVPLLTNSAGEKIGKSTGGSQLWLDPIETTPYDLYGYFVRQADEDVERLLKLFTFIPTAEIRSLVEEHEADKPKRVAQHRLAVEVLRLVHGEEVAKHAQAEHQSLHGKGSLPLTFSQSPDEQKTLNNTPLSRVKLPKSLILGTSIARILYAAGLATSVSDGQRLAVQKAAYIGAQPSGAALASASVNWFPVATWFVENTKKYIIDDKILLLRKGKHHIRVIEIVDDEEYAASGLTYPGQPNTGRVRMALAQQRENASLRRSHLEALQDDLSVEHEKDSRDSQQQQPLRPTIPPSDSKLVALRKQFDFFKDNFDPTKHNPKCHPEKLKARIERLEKQQRLFDEDGPKSGSSGQDPWF